MATGEVGISGPMLFLSFSLLADCTVWILYSDNGNGLMNTNSSILVLVFVCLSRGSRESAGNGENVGLKCLVTL